VSGKGLPPSWAQPITLDAVYHSRPCRALGRWRGLFGAGRVDIDRVGLPALLDFVQWLGEHTELIAVSGEDGLDYIALHSTMDYDGTGGYPHLLRSMRQFENQNLLVAASLTLPDVFATDTAVAHRLSGTIGNRQLLYDRVAFPVFRGTTPRFLVTVCGFLRGEPTTAIGEIG